MLGLMQSNAGGTPICSFKQGILMETSRKQKKPPYAGSLLKGPPNEQEESPRGLENLFIVGQWMCLSGLLAMWMTAGDADCCTDTHVP